MYVFFNFFIYFQHALHVGLTKKRARILINCLPSRANRSTPLYIWVKEKREQSKHDEIAFTLVMRCEKITDALI